MARRKEMKMKLTGICSGIVILMVATAMGAQAKNLKGVEITDEFPLDRCIATVGLVTSCVGDDCNQYLPLIVDRVWELDNEGCDDCDESEAVRVSILGATQMVDGQLTRVMEEREWVDGELTEVSRNFLNQCGNTQDVYYWGEEVCVQEGSDAAEEPPFEYGTPCEEGLEPGGGAWKAGVDGAEPGILFPGGAFLVGARYFQEFAENAQDWAEHAEMGLSFDNPANGQFEDCVLVIDRNALEDPKGKEGDEKAYCPDIGIVQDEEMELTSCVDPMGDCAQ
jgi:hypothetical protein